MVKKESSEISKNTSLKPEALLNIMQDLEKEKKKFENLFENSADAIFITDIGEKKITDCNKKALDITGYNKEEIIGMHPKYLHPKEIREESMKVFEKYNYDLLQKTFLFSLIHSLIVYQCPLLRYLLNYLRFQI